ncbi:hypothetical protein WJX72_010070 [[Myrmecia] bisecta]|uniref:Guanylate kinase n=1 Tax=[Myrmecia] bisecta TaxID=41462 RepID=A0AAW1P933_9CHLO
MLESQLGNLSTEPTVAPAKPLVVVISGPSGVGKDAVIKQLQEARPDLHFVVTATSRQRRPGEQEGVDYFFVSEERFKQWVHAGDMLEHAVVYGEYKGIQRSQVTNALARGTDVVLRLDVQGAATIRHLIPEAVSIFLVAESEAKLVSRLIARKTEPLDKMLVRVETARQEMSCIQDFDYVVNNRDGELDQAVGQIEAIIVAEKLKVWRQNAKAGESL